MTNEPFTPLANASEAALAARNLVRDNKTFLWSLFKPMLPALLALDALSAAVQLGFAESHTAAKVIEALFQIIGFYFYGLLGYSWHRFVLIGRDAVTPPDFFKPTSDQWRFLGYLALSAAASIVVMTVSAATGTVLLGKTGIIVGLLAGIVFSVWIGYKLCFLLPSAAVGDGMTIRQSFTHTRGVFWKLLGSGFLASWRVAVVSALCVGTFVGVMTLLIGSFEGSALVLAAAFLNVFGTLAIMDVFFNPLLTVLGVTILSNYYLVLRNAQAGR